MTTFKLRTKLITLIKKIGVISDVILMHILRFFTNFLLHTTKLIDDVFEALHGKYGVEYRLPKRVGLDSTVRIESDATFQSGPPSITGLYIRNDGKNGLNIAELDSEYYRLVYHPSRSVLADKRIIKTSPVDPSDIVDPKTDDAFDMETEELSPAK